MPEVLNTMESMIDLKALLVEREDCDAGTVQQLRNALAQGGPQYRSLRDVADVLKKKLEGATGDLGPLSHHGHPEVALGAGQGHVEPDAIVA